VSIQIHQGCDCANQHTLNAERLNTLCLCPQQTPAATSAMQIAAVPVFVAAHDLQQMTRLIHSIEKVVHSAAWQQKILLGAPAIAQHNPGNPGVLFGYDFHLSDTGPQLIEINTNAGGALIVAEVLRAQSGCCASGAVASPSCQAQQAETAIIDSLLSDFESVRGHRQPRLIAIVDHRPADQYLYPEFLQFAELLRARNLHVEICDPAELIADAQGLTLHGNVVDLIYNRLTDFYLADEKYAALRDAYLNNAVAITPNPHHHALYADKRHLALLSDAQILNELNVAPADQHILLNGIPETRYVDRAHAEELWQQRKQYFFKPATAYGGKGAYRGAKLTRSTFEELLDADYVAQREVEPPLRRARIDGETTDLKVDVRCYVYRGEIQLTAARLWRGQTTNFRTPGGGFATVSATAL
jgi:hypothetical protein